MVNCSRWAAKCLALLGLASSLASSGAFAQGAEAVITDEVTNDKGNVLEYANSSAPQFNKAVAVNSRGSTPRCSGDRTGRDIHRARPRA